MIASKNKTNDILNKYNLQAKKRYGQNFLIDGNIVQKIIELANIDENTGVVEIGPGIGAMTEVIIDKAKKVLCYEIDSQMVEILENEIVDKKDNIKIINNDFLKCELNKDLDYLKDCERIITISNLPYYITSPIVFKLLEEENLITEMYFMMQKEVAQRFTGIPSTKDYNSLSVIIKYKSTAKYEFDVSRNCFFPSPNVDSGIVSIKKKKNDYSVKNELIFLEFVKTIFEMKRKTLINNLLAKKLFDRVEMERKIVELGFDKNVRAESLSLDDIIKIYNSFFN